MSMSQHLKTMKKNDEGENHRDITSIIKISLTVLVIGYALGKSRCCLVDDVFFVADAGCSIYAASGSRDYGISMAK